ncbi:uncharacterized protein LOC141854276 [Brevipalpus obovatus]|uniref:uncharacterized protein LOC141854276 n=1 Tax=Brevipalpus obovatus TaxID=246614 RepID=UPI003D9DB9FA
MRLNRECCLRTFQRTFILFLLSSLCITGLVFSLQDKESSFSSSSSSLPSPSPVTSFKCPEQFGYFHDYTDCTKYFVCVFGEALHETCTNGLYFSEELQTCDWPRNVRCILGAPPVRNQTISDAPVTIGPNFEPNTDPNIPKENPTPSSINLGYDDLSELDGAKEAAIRTGINPTSLPPIVPVSSVVPSERDKETENTDLQRSRSSVSRDFVTRTGNSPSTGLNNNYVNYNRDTASVQLKPPKTLPIDQNIYLVFNNHSLSHSTSTGVHEIPYEIDIPSRSYDPRSVVDAVRSGQDVHYVPQPQPPPQATSLTSQGQAIPRPRGLIGPISRDRPIVIGIRPEPRISSDDGSTGSDPSANDPYHSSDRSAIEVGVGVERRGEDDRSGNRRVSNEPIVGRTERSHSESSSSNEFVDTRAPERRRGVPHYQLQHFHQQQHFRSKPPNIGGNVGRSAPRSSDSRRDQPSDYDQPSNVPIQPPTTPKRQGYGPSPYESYPSGPQFVPVDQPRDQDQPEPISPIQPPPRSRARPPQRNHQSNPGFIEYTDNINHPAPNNAGRRDNERNSGYYYDNGRYGDDDNNNNNDDYKQDPPRGPLVPLPPPSLATPRPPTRMTPEPPLPPPSPPRLNNRNDRNDRFSSAPRSNPHFRPYVPPYAGFERPSAIQPQPVSSHRHRPNNNNRAPVADPKPARPPTPAPWDYVESDSPDTGRSISHEPPSNSRYTIAEPINPPTQPPPSPINHPPDNDDYGGLYDVPDERDVYHNNNDQETRYRNQPRPPSPAVVPIQSTPKPIQSRPPTPPRHVHRPASRPTRPKSAVVAPAPPPKPAPAPASAPAPAPAIVTRIRDDDSDSGSYDQPETDSIGSGRGSGVPSEHGQPFGLVDYDIDEIRRQPQPPPPPAMSTPAPDHHRPATALVEVRPAVRLPPRQPNAVPAPASSINEDVRQNRPRSRPTKKRLVVKPKVTPPPVPAGRPRNVYPTTEPFSNAVKCDPRQCRLPDCNCGSATIPGGLSRDQVPQIVMITFDDAINDLNLDIYDEIFDNKRKNPNGCPLLGTFYVSHEWTDYGHVQTLYSKGHEMASHGVTHSFGEKFSKNQWHKEVTGQREILHLYGGVKLEDVRGMRAPFLQIGGNKMFEVLYDDNFTYDSSMPVFDNKPPFWPYTLDYSINHECMIAPCPTESFPGIWEVGMVMLEDHRGGRCSMADACSNPTDENGVYNMLLKNFKRHYNSNRAPFGLYYHSAWFNSAHHRKAFIRFIDEIIGYGDVFFTTKWQMLQWMRQPTPLEEIQYFEPWDCRSVVANRPPPCNHAKVCNVQGAHGHQFMKTCQPCPSVYPWVGNTGFKKNS